MTVRKLEIKDIPQALNIVEAVHIKNLKSLENGFLMIGNASLDLYRKWLADSPYCYVAQDQEKVVGVFVALPGVALAQSYACLVEDYLENGLIFVVQVAVYPEFHGRGVGRKMYERFFADAKEEKNIFSSSMKKPHNKASEQFHLKMGFEKVKIYSWDNGEECFIYRHTGCGK